MFRVYVGNLPYRVLGAQLREFFEQAGCTVSDATVILERNEGGYGDDRHSRPRSKGFGFAEFADEESYKKALALDGTDLDGRPLRINEARPREDRNGDAPRPMAQPAEVAAVEPAVDDSVITDADF